MENQKLGVKELAEIIGVTPRRIQQLVDEKVLTRDSRGQYELGSNVRAYIKHVELQSTSEGKQLRVERERTALEQTRLKAKFDAGDLVPAKSQEVMIAAIDLAGERSIGLLERHLVNVLWPAGVRDINMVHASLFDCKQEFAGWMRAAIDMARRGATVEHIKKDLFNSHGTPPIGPVAFGTPERTKRQRKKDE